MTVKEIADSFGMSTETFFRNAFERHGGLTFSLGPPSQTHAHYLKTGVIPPYVHRYVGEMERLLTRHHASIN